MKDAVWKPLLTELDRWKAAGITARLWLRDDDAVEPSPALDRFAELTSEFRIPAVLAIIPAKTGRPLADWLGGTPQLTPAIHGWSHANHAPAGEKKQELGLHRGREPVLTELGKALLTMTALHGDRLLAMLVPPWNRIDASLIPDLRPLGYEFLSTFGEPAHEHPGLPVINSQIDLIDFRGTRRCHDHSLLARMIADELARSRLVRRSAVGILSHHLIDNEGGLQFLGDLFAVTVTHPACRWANAVDLA
jgi:hypothetical protein